MSPINIDNMMRQKQLLSTLPSVNPEQNFAAQAGAAPSNPAQSAMIQQTIPADTSQPGSQIPTTPQEGAIGRAALGALTGGAMGGGGSDQSMQANLGQRLGGAIKNALTPSGSPKPGSTGPPDPTPAQTPHMMQMNPDGTLSVTPAANQRQLLQLPTQQRYYDPSQLGTINE